MSAVPFTLCPPTQLSNEINELAQAIQAPCFVVELLSQRGIFTPQDAEDFFDTPREKFLLDPSTMLGMHSAVQWLLKRREQNQEICVYGDYDLDGISGTALLFLALRQAGWKMRWMLPSRFRGGYGLAIESLDLLAAEGVNSLVVVDTGITAVEEIARANELGISVLVVDHHRPSGDELPAAHTILNPHQVGCNYFNKNLCAAGVAWKLVAALYNILNLVDAENYLPLVALGTIADMVPMVGENRWLVREGLRRMGSSPEAGLRRLASQGNSQDTLRSQDILFRVAPLLNAPGRMGDPDLALRLLISQDKAESEELFATLEKLNEARKNLEAEATRLALAQFDGYDRNLLPPVLCLASDQWHSGIIGIVAAKIMGIYQRPTAVLAIEGDLARASARGLPGFDWHEALYAVRDVLERWGGHPRAAGFTVRTERIPELRKRLRQWAVDKSFKPSAQEILQSQVELELAHLEPHVMEWMDRFEPFGPGNEAPLFLARQAAIAGRCREVRGGHLQMDLGRGGGRSFPSIGFGMATHLPWLRERGGKPFALAYHPTWNHFNGRRILQLMVKGFAEMPEIIESKEKI